MSERTYKIADGILDSAQEEYREINLADADAVAAYALNGMGIAIGDEEAEAILNACKEYIRITESDDFDGQGQLARDRTLGALWDFETRGGKREGAGRKSTDTYDIKVRVNATQHETLKNLGGSSWLQKTLDSLEGCQIVDTKTFTEEQKEAFIEGWEAAGGYIDDLETSCPWCCPWYHGNTKIEVKGDDPRSWGAQWWDQCKDEVEQLLKEEREAEEDEDED